MSIAIFMDSGRQISDLYTNHKTAKSAPRGERFCSIGMDILKELQVHAEQAEVYQKDDRYADHKSCMSCLVAKDEHTGQSANAAAEKCQKHECPLRDAPPLADCSALVCVVYKESDDIDRQQPERHKAHDILKSR